MNDRYAFEITKGGELIITLLDGEPVVKVGQARGPCGPTLEFAEGRRLARLRWSSVECFANWIKRFGGRIEFGRKM